MGVLQLFLFRAVTLIVFSHDISSSSASAAGFSCVKAGCQGAARVAAVRQELWMEPERLAAIPGEGAAPRCAALEPALGIPPRRGAGTCRTLSCFTRKFPHLIKSQILSIRVQELIVQCQGHFCLALVRAPPYPLPAPRWSQGRVRKPGCTGGSVSIQKNPKRLC